MTPEDEFVQLIQDEMGSILLQGFIRTSPTGDLLYTQLSHAVEQIKAKARCIYAQMQRIKAEREKPTTIPMKRKEQA